jgi:hypothetical protein
LGQHVTTWIFEIDQDDVGIEAVDARKKAGRFFDPRDVDVASLAQTVDEDRGAYRIFVNDDDLERGVPEEQSSAFPAVKQPSSCKNHSPAELR